MRGRNLFWVIKTITYRI